MGRGVLFDFPCQLFFLLSVLLFLPRRRGVGQGAGPPQALPLDPPPRLYNSLSNLTFKVAQNSFHHLDFDGPFIATLNHLMLHVQSYGIKKRPNPW